MRILCDGTVRFSKMGVAALLGFSALCTPLSVSARPLTPAETRDFPSGYEPRVPACNDPGVMSQIQSRFSQTESQYWHSGLAIQGFDKIGEIGYRTNGLDYIPRRYCVAQALMSDMKPRPVSYTIVQETGIIGFWFTYGVEWCVEGLDRERAYAPGCQGARP